MAGGVRLWKNRADYSPVKALVLTSVLLVVLATAGGPSEGRLAIVLLLIAGWVLAGVRWLVRRFGRKAVVVLAGLAVLSGGAAGYSYWRDGPNRQLVARLKELHASRVDTSGTLLTGEVEAVFFDAEAGDEDVKEFVKLEGLQGLKYLVLQGTRLTDETALKLARLGQLRHLVLEDTRLSREIIEQLEEEMPGCAVVVK